MKSYVMNTLVIVLIAAVLLSAAYVLYGRWLANKWGIDPKAETPAKKLVKAYAAGSATFLVEGLQLIIAILLMALGLIIVINSLKAYFKAQKESA